MQMFLKKNTRSLNKKKYFLISFWTESLLYEVSLMSHRSEITGEVPMAVRAGHYLNNILPFKIYIKKNIKIIKKRKRVNIFVKNVLPSDRVMNHSYNSCRYPPPPLNLNYLENHKMVYCLLILFAYAALIFGRKTDFLLNRAFFVDKIRIRHRFSSVNRPCGYESLSNSWLQSLS